jgi:serine/threonine protein phosphatase 1
LFNWFRSKTRARARSVPPGSRIYAVGDIHGRLDLLESLEEMIAADAAEVAPARRVVVYLGDYVDRGMEARQVVDRLMASALDGFEAVHLKGNHEDFLLRFLDDVQIGAGWLRNGGNTTLYSYGIRPPDRPTDIAALQRARDELRRRLPPAHLDFYRGLEHSHVEGDYFFAHAGVMPGRPLDRQAPEDLMWIREDFLECPDDHGKIVVHGHTITEQPDIRGNRIGIDTGAYATGCLTALVLEGTTHRFLQT